MKRFRNSKYLVTPDGRVFSEYRNIFLSPRYVKAGYCRVSITINKVSKDILIHRMVAECYIDNPNNYTEVNHIDNNPGNNSLENLEWCSPKMNRDHTKSQMRQAYGSRSGRSKLNESQVQEIRRKLKNKEKITYIAKEFNVAYQVIQGIRDGRYWIYLKEEESNGKKSTK